MIAWFPLTFLGVHEDGDPSRFAAFLLLFALPLASIVLVRQSVLDWILTPVYGVVSVVCVVFVYTILVLPLPLLMALSHKRVTRYVVRRRAQPT